MLHHKIKEKSKTGSTIQQELIYFEVTNPKTLAASVLLKNYLREQDEDFFNKYREISKRIEFSRNYLTNVLQREGSLKCSYCHKDNLTIELEGMKVPRHKIATIDHVVPISKGGAIYDVDNIVVACGVCNGRKSNMSVEQFKQKYFPQNNIQPQTEGSFVKTTKHNLTLKNGFRVIVDEKSHFHYNDFELLQEGLNQLTKTTGFIREEIHFDRIIGETTCVKVDENDEIYYAVRGNRRGKSKMVRNRKPIPTNVMSIMLTKRNGCYYLITSYIGKLAPAETWDKRAFLRQNNPRQAEQESIEFWKNHALIAE